MRCGHAIRLPGLERERVKGLIVDERVEELTKVIFAVSVLLNIGLMNKDIFCFIFLKVQCTQWVLLSCCVSVEQSKTLNRFLVLVIK